MPHLKWHLSSRLTWQLINYVKFKNSYLFNDNSGSKPTSCLVVLCPPTPEPLGLGVPPKLHNSTLTLSEGGNSMPQKYFIFIITTHNTYPTPNTHNRNNPRSINYASLGNSKPPASFSFPTTLSIHSMVPSCHMWKHPFSPLTMCSSWVVVSPSWVCKFPLDLDSLWASGS